MYSLMFVLASTPPAGDLASDRINMIYKTESAGDANVIPNASIQSEPDNGGYYYPLWGTDRLVSNTPAGYPAGLAIDVADNGDIYVAILRKISGDIDTLEMVRSTDGGYTWSRWSYIIGEIDSRGIDIAVGGGSNPWIYTVIDFDASSPYSLHGIVVRRMKADGSAYDWAEITNVDTVRSPVLSINDDEILALTYISDNDNVFRALSTDSALTWTTYYANNRVSSASIYISDNGRGYHAYVRNDTIVWIVTFNAPSLGGIDINSIVTDTARHVSITAGPGAATSQNAIVVWANRHASADVWDVHYSTSTDGGQTWSSNSPFPPTNFSYPSGDYMNYPYVHRDRHISSFRFTTTFVSSFDSVYYAYSSSGTTWNSAEVINDHDATTSFGPRVDYCADAGGGCIVYREYASDNIWMDAFNYTAQDESSTTSVSIKVRGLNLQISVPDGERATVKVLSVNGRVVASESISGSGTLKLPHSGMFYVITQTNSRKYINKVIAY